MADPFKVAMAVLGLLLILVGGAVLVLPRTGSFSSSAEQESPETPTALAPADRPAVPAVDAAAPAQTETATFALG